MTAIIVRETNLTRYLRELLRRWLLTYRQWLSCWEGGVNALKAEFDQNRMQDSGYPRYPG